jgi:alkanesulfonate monooxygenase SsuD/methylene tetrahydromethanopterin reductase-like flavin-dependent oxidoreductase (luciferase family)
LSGLSNLLLHILALQIEVYQFSIKLELLAFVAANTEKIRLGTAVIDISYHNPVILAREFATLDVLSEGRVTCGFGLGSLKDEYRVANIPFKGRKKRADEFLQMLKRIWTDDVIKFKGEFYDIPASKIGPKPVLYLLFTWEDLLQIHSEELLIMMLKDGL